MCTGLDYHWPPAPCKWPPWCCFKAGFFLLGPSQWRLKAGSSHKGNLQKPANPTHFRSQLGNPLVSVLEFFGWGEGSVAYFFLWWGFCGEQGAAVLGRALVCKMALEQAVETQDRAWRSTAPWVRGSAHPMEDADLHSSSLASPLRQDLLWSRLN